MTGKTPQADLHLEFLEKYTQSLVGKKWFKRWSHHDIFAEAYLAARKIEHAWDPEKSKFTSYCMVRLKSMLWDAYCKQHAGKVKRSKATEWRRIIRWMEICESDFFDSEAGYKVGDDFASIFDKYCVQGPDLSIDVPETLTEKEKSVVLMLSEGLQYRDIASRIGLSHTSITIIMRSIRVKYYFATDGDPTLFTDEMWARVQKRLSTGGGPK